MNINSPIPDQWNEYVSQTNLGLEVIPHMLYSVKPYISTVTTILTFFDTVEGSRADLTNMSQPNMLPNPEAFLIQNIRIFSWFQPQSNDSGAGDCADLVSEFSAMVELTKRGILRLKIGNKQYGPWPLWTLPAHNFVKGAFSTGSDLLGDYGQVDGMLYPLNPYIMIAPLQQFTVSLQWPGATTDTPIAGGPVTFCPTATPPAVTQVPIQILFDGQMSRSIQ